MVTSIKNICVKLKGEVGMAIPKSTQTRVVGIITYMVHPYACLRKREKVQLHLRKARERESIHLPTQL